MTSIWTINLRDVVRNISTGKQGRVVSINHQNDTVTVAHGSQRSTLLLTSFVDQYQTIRKAH